MIVASITARAVMRLTGAEDFRSVESLFLMTATTSGYGA
jgi:hypothetical protein